MASQPLNDEDQQLHSFPISLISPLCSVIYTLSLPPDPRDSLDPRVPPTGHATARELLLALSLVSREFYYTARPWLWRTLRVSRPRGWIGIVRKIGPDEATEDKLLDEEGKVNNKPYLLEPSFPHSPSSRSRNSSPDHKPALQHPGMKRSQSIERTPIYMEAQLLGGGLKRSTSLNAEKTVGAMERRYGESTSSRRGSMRGRRERESSVFSIIEGVEVKNVHPSPLSPLSICYPTPSADPDAVEDPALLASLPDPHVAELEEEQQQHHHQDPEEDYHQEEPVDEEVFQESLNEAGLPTRLLDFSTFRVTGLRRSLEEGISGKYVTPERLGLLLSGLGNLEAFGGTEYMDSSLTLSNLISLFFRGTSTLPPTLDPDEWSHLMKFRPLIALDLTGVNSRIFGKAISDFVATFLQDPPAPDPTSPVSEGGMPSLLGSIETLVAGMNGWGGNGNGHAREKTVEEVEEEKRLSYEKESVFFPYLQRLSLRSCKLIPGHDLGVLLPRFTNLTHVDLSYTRVDGEALMKLREMPLRSINLSRCSKLAGPDFLAFLMHPNRSELLDLNLYYTASFPLPLDPISLKTIITSSPAFTSSKLRYLDLSASPLSAEHLASFPPQPSLLSLGLSHIPSLSIRPLAQFMIEKAPQCEILTLTNTGTEIVRANNMSMSMVALQTLLINPCTASPISFDRTAPPEPARTRLRVVEVGSALLGSLSKGFHTNWRVIRTKDSRGFYVDTASGWVSPSRPTFPFPAFTLESESPVFRRNIESDHPWRTYLRLLADSDGKVESGVGWHSRKMEVLWAEGMLGRAEGLYGASGFSYDD